MERLNSRGLPRHTLRWALGQRRIVELALREDRCLLCRSDRVNEAGLCQTCYALLDDREIELAELWIGGRAP